ncbi:hypothetical protein [Mucilaginibacter sp.]|jgi:hypothetical protein|uniref:hypothetical protein n=1 Tax=Mucilaginibacter sp. TaxID=1882438 RepID=UPI002CD80A14|nr:hypothetical protein [Mucilaginibacter sp.]HTI61203.1 hypothetical protein [Mucilaginibacter sp.]
MERIWILVKRFFTSINYRILGGSLAEVGWLTLFALLPLIINIIIAGIPANSLTQPIANKIVPGEILSYCLSFLAPSLYLLTRLQGSGYRLPWLHSFSIITLLVYIASVVLYLIAKNRWVSQIDLQPHGINLYFKLTVIFFLIALIFRVYAVYHGRNFTSFSIMRAQQQDDFNAGFVNSLNRPQQ